MKYIFSVLILLGAGWAHAEEATCSVKGMHCTGCRELVEGKVCDAEKFSTCEVKILDAKKEIGQIKITTKDAAATIDQKAIGALVVDAGYKMEKCTVKPSAKPAKG